MKRLFSIVGWILLIGSILVPLILVAFLSKEAISSGLIIFVLGFFPGKYLIKIGMGGKKESRLNKIALIIILPILVIEIILWCYYILINLNIIPVNQVWDPKLFLFLYFTFFMPIPYSISLILLIIDYFKQSKANQKPF